MKKILASLAIIAVVSASTVSATQAYFSDTEKSIGNTFTAGTLDLKVDDKDGEDVVHIVRDNMKPQPPWTYQGYNQQWVLKNTGSLPGTLTVTIKNVQNFENGCNDPEIKAGDTTCTTAEGQGELGQYTWIKWMNNGGSIPFSSPQFNPFNTAANVVVTGPVLQPGDTLPAYMWLDFPWRSDNAENMAQSDSLSFDIEFKLEQIH